MPLSKDEADANLHKALHDHAMAYGLAREDELLSEFAVIVNWQRETANGFSSYTTHFHVAHVPNHVAVGLFAVGQKLAFQDDSEE